MNSLKNLMILAVLTAVGYGVYVSLSRNNADQNNAGGLQKHGSQNDVALTAKTRGSLAVGPATTASATSIGVAAPAMNLASTSASPSPLANNSITSATGVGTPAPYQSSATPSTTLTAPSLSGTTPIPISTAAVGVPAPTASSVPPTPVVPSNSAMPAGNPSSINNVVNLSPPPTNTSPAGVSPINTLPTNTATTSNSTPAAPNTAADNLTQSTFSALMERAQKLLERGQFAEVQLALSDVYFSTYFNAESPVEVDRAKQIVNLLDQLAGTVIYSREPYLPNSTYTVAPGDTLARIAERCQVPWQLLARINGLMPAGASNEDIPLKDQPLSAGTKLKVIQGPFEAIVRLDRRELTLMVQRRYAARFTIGIGYDQPQLEGKYTVGKKMLKPPYYGPDRTVISPNDPKNPLGGAWIGLSDTIGIHGTPNPRDLNRSDNRGTICVGDQDLQDLYGILAAGSPVTVLR